MDITLINFVLTAIILVFGVWVYLQNKSMVALTIGVAFGLFAISHLITLLNLATQLNTVVIVIRIVAYLVALYALYRIWKAQA